MKIGVDTVMKHIYYALLPIIFLFIYGLIVSPFPFPFFFLVYMVWLLMILVPAIAAFGFQCFACNATKSLLLQLLPTAAVLVVIVLECIHPFYGTFLYFISAMIGLTPYLIIPAVIFGLLAGWNVRPDKSNS